ncbi:MAG: hypothetical protein DRJ40_03235 [Thermoprotei archaeon]|nr:MAG: hypothetical protein DRJ40_03235 [Thermoprotei archaeon]
MEESKELKFIREVLPQVAPTSAYSLLLDTLIKILKLLNQMNRKLEDVDVRLKRIEELLQKRESEELRRGDT